MSNETTPKPVAREYLEIKVLRAIAELRDLSLGELLEAIVQDAFAGKPAFEESMLPPIRELPTNYGLPSLSVYDFSARTRQAQ